MTSSYPIRFIYFKAPPVRKPKHTANKGGRPRQILPILASMDVYHRIQLRSKELFEIEPSRLTLRYHSIRDEAIDSVSSDYGLDFETVRKNCTDPRRYAVSARATYDALRSMLPTVTDNAITFAFREYQIGGIAPDDDAVCFNLCPLIPLATWMRTKKT